MKAAACLLIVAVVACGTGCRSSKAGYQTQLEANEATAVEADRADARMNKLCGEIRPRLDAEGRAKFDAAQNAWLAYRKAEAESRADFFRGGSIVPAVYCQSLTDSTERRIGQLQAGLDELNAH